MLRTPVKFDAGGMIISYNELALIEPGETGSLFGSPEFYDYVIVEGSVNYGKSWFPVTTVMIPGTRKHGKQLTTAPLWIIIQPSRK